MNQTRSFSYLVAALGTVAVISAQSAVNPIQVSVEKDIPIDLGVENAQKIEPMELAERQALLIEVDRLTKLEASYAAAVDAESNLAAAEDSIFEETIDRFRPIDSVFARTPH